MNYKNDFIPNNYFINDNLMIYDDPPVDLPQKENLNLKNLIENIKELKICSRYKDLIQLFRFVFENFNSINNIDDDQLIKSNLCQILIEFTSQSDQFELQLISLDCLILIIKKSKKGVENCLNFNVIQLLKLLHEHPLEKIRLLSYSLSSFLSNNQKGFEALFNLHFFDFYIDLFLTIIEEISNIINQNIIMSFFPIFKPLIDNLNLFPKNTLNQIVLIFSKSLLYIPSTIIFLPPLINKIKSLEYEGILLLINSQLLENLINILKINNLNYNKKKIIQFLIHLTQVKFEDSKKILLKFLNLKKLFQILLLINPINDYYETFLFLCSQVATFDSQNYQFLNKIENENLIKNCFEYGKIQQKIAMTNFLLTILYFVDVEDKIKLLKKEIFIISLDIIESCSGKILKYLLKSLANILITFINLKNINYISEQPINIFFEKCQNICLLFINYPDHSISEIANSILKDFYPEIYYSQIQ